MFHTTDASGSEFQVRLPKLEEISRPAFFSQVNEIHFVLEHGPLAQTIPNILTLAAVFRAITIARGTEPLLQIVGEIQLSNKLNQNGGLSELLKDSNQNTILLLTAASYYRSQYANLYGQYYVAGARLIDNIDIVNDNIKLGERRDPHRPILEFLQQSLRVQDDSIISDLLDLSEAASTSKQNFRLEKYARALETLEVETRPFPISKKKSIELIPGLLTLIRELARGDKESELLRKLDDKHLEANQMAERLWSNAKEISQGVFLIEAVRFDEQDSLVSHCLKNIYTKDERVNYLLEHDHDRPANAVRYDESINFSRRLELGESAEDLLKEVVSLLELRKDRGTLMDIALAESREREAISTLETILEKALYLPDPNGKHHILKYPQDLDLYDKMREAQIPLIVHNALWICDLRHGTARPFSIEFQNKELEKFLSSVAIEG